MQNKQSIIVAAFRFKNAVSFRQNATMKYNKITIPIQRCAWQTMFKVQRLKNYKESSTLVWVTQLRAEESREEKSVGIAKPFQKDKKASLLRDTTMQPGDIQKVGMVIMVIILLPRLLSMSPSTSKVFM